jgi:DNA-binding response OmpR family regulator
MIAQSRRLIETVDHLIKWPANKLDQFRSSAKNHADVPPSSTNLGSEPSPVRRVIRTGTLAVYPGARMVAIEGRPLHLTTKEYAILELLSLRKGTIVTREMLRNRLYGGRDEPELKIIDVFVCKLRQKIARANGGDHHIGTVSGRGYVLNDTPQLKTGAVNIAS